SFSSRLSRSRVERAPRDPRWLSSPGALSELEYQVSFGCLPARAQLRTPSVDAGIARPPAHLAAICPVRSLSRQLSPVPRPRSPTQVVDRGRGPESIGGVHGSNWSKVEGGRPGEMVQQKRFHLPGRMQML